MPQSISSSTLTSFGLELGIFCVASLLVATLILIKIKGNLRGLEIFFATKNWEFIKKSPRVKLYARIFQIMIFFMIMWPLLSLIAWGVSVLQLAYDKKVSALSDKIPGSAIFLIGTCLILWIIGILQTKWNNFQMSKITACLLVLGTFSFWAFQLVCLLLTDEKYSYFGLSAVFLMINACIVLLIVFMYFSKDSATIKEIIDTHIQDIKEGQTIPQLEEGKPVDDMINKQLEDPNYFPSKQEILSFCTIIKDIEGIQSTALCGGLQQFYKQKSDKVKVVILIFLYLLSLGVLVAYSVIVYFCSEEKVLGPVTAVAVVVTDLLLLFMMNVKMANGPVIVTLLVIAFRACLFGFGGKMWFLGYCLLYLIFGIFLNFHIINKYLPLRGEIKAVEEQKTFKQKILKAFASPEILQMLSTTVFTIIIITISTDAKQEDIPTEAFEVYGEEYNLWMYGLASILFNLLTLFYLSTIRIYRREQNGIRSNYNKTRIGQKLPLYYLFLFLSYGLLIFFGVIWFKIEKEESLVISSFVFLPIIYEFLLVIQFNWKLNDYKFIANITEFNKKMENLKEKLLAQQKRNFAVRKVAQRHINLQKEGKDDQNFDLEKSIQNELQILNQELDKKIIADAENEKLIKQQQEENERLIKKKQEEDKLKTEENKDKKEENKDKKDENNEDKEKQEVKKEEKKEEVKQEKQLNPILGEFEQIYDDLIKQYQVQEDWREQNLSFFSAFTKRKLLTSDYRIIFSFILIFFFMLGYSLCVLYSSKRYELLGFTISISLFSCMMIYMPIIQYLETLQKPSITQMFVFFIGFALNYGWGFFYYFYKTKDTTIDDNPAAYYLLYFAFLVPWFICVFFAYIKYIQEQKNFNIKTNVLIVLSALIAFGKGGYLIYARGVIVGCCVMALWFFVYYFLLVFFFYKKNNNQVTKCWRIASLVILILICALSLITSLVFKDFSDFLGFSISYLVLNLLMFIYASYLIYLDLADRSKQPLFSSPWVFPIFKYDNKTQTIQTHSDPLTIFLFSCLFFLLWCIALTIWIQPVSAGVTACCLVEIFLFIMLMYISTWATQQLGNSQGDIDSEVIKKSWLQAKKTFYENKKELIHSQMKTHSYYQNKKQQRLQLLQEFQNGTAERNFDYYKQVSELFQQYYKSELKCQGAFDVEVKVLVHFQLSILAGSVEIKRKKMKEFLTFIENKKSSLLILGVEFVTKPGLMLLEDQYEDIMDQIEEFPEALQKEIFRLQEQYKQSIENARKQEELRLLQEQEASKKREEELKKKLKEEEDEKKRQEDEIRKQLLLAEEKKKKEEEELKRKQEEEELRKKKEEEDRLRKEEEEKKRKEDEERQKRELEEKQKREAEELLLKQQEEEIRKRREEDERKRLEEEKNNQLQEEEKKIREEEERKKREQEELLLKQQEEEIRKRREEDERKRQEEENERRRKEEEERIRKEQEQEQKRLLEEQEAKRKQQEQELRQKKEQEELERKVQEEMKQREQEQMANSPLHQIPDSIQKYQQIIEQYKKTGTKYVDQKFKADKSILGRLQVQAIEWKRPGPNAVLFKDGISSSDAKQGSLKDCYFISAISVLGQTRVQNALLWDDPSFDQEGKQQCGAYIVRYFINNKPIYVIVDDYLPYVGNQLYFGCSQDQDELWPAILEKSYAKLYGDYESIEAGRVETVLCEFTNGSSQYIQLNQYYEKIDNLWKMLLEYRQKNFIMGCGGIEQQGEEYENENGLISQHAYAILDVRDVDGNRLVQLRNPHGSESLEWNGDWSDNSTKWTDRLKQLVGFESSYDGKFWMSVEDLCYQFGGISVCKVYEPPAWYQIGNFSNVWTKMDANSKINQPQYGICVNGPCSVIVQLINQIADPYSGVGKYIYNLGIYKNGGKRIVNEKNLPKAFSGMGQKQYFSQEVKLENDSYPYVFTLLTLAKIMDDAQNPFSLILYCSDQSAVAIDSTQFDV